MSASWANYAPATCQMLPRHLRAPAAAFLAATMLIGLVLVRSHLVDPASAATLGGLNVANLTAATMPDGRCDDAIAVEPGNSIDDPLTYDEIHLSDVAPECDGLTAHITVRAEDGTALATGTATASSPSFTIELSTLVGLGDYAGVALEIDTRGIPTYPIGDDVDVNVVIPPEDDWGAGYCADVTVSTTSPTPIEWTAIIDLSDYPLNGTPDEVWDADWSFDEPILTASGLSHNETVVVGSPETWGFCALRGTPPPDPGSLTVTKHIHNDWSGGYCATVQVSTDSEVPISWEVEIDLSTFPWNGTPTSAGNAIFSFSAPIMTAVGQPNNNDTIQEGDPANWSFCANRPAGAPVVHSLSPNSLGQGVTQNVTIGGGNFQNGATVAFSGPGVTVNSVTFTGAWQLVANVTVAPDAPLGDRDIIVTNPGDVVGGRTAYFKIT